MIHGHRACWRKGGQRIERGRSHGHSTRTVGLEPVDGVRGERPSRESGWPGTAGAAFCLKQRKPEEAEAVGEERKAKGSHPVSLLGVWWLLNRGHLDTWLLPL